MGPSAAWDSVFRSWISGVKPPNSSWERLCLRLTAPLGDGIGNKFHNSKWDFNFNKNIIKWKKKECMWKPICYIHIRHVRRILECIEWVFLDEHLAKVFTLDYRYLVQMHVCLLYLRGKVQNDKLVRISRILLHVNDLVSYKFNLNKGGALCM